MTGMYFAQAIDEARRAYETVAAELVKATDENRVLRLDNEYLTKEVLRLSEKVIWPNCYEQGDIRFIAIDGTVYFNDGRWYSADDGSGYWSHEGWETTRSRWEKDRWPNRLEMSDVAFIANANTSNTRSWVFFTNGDVFNSDRGTWNVGDVGDVEYWRNFYEVERWPNRIEQYNIVNIFNCGFDSDSDVDVTFNVVIHKPFSDVSKGLCSSYNPWSYQWA